MPENSKRRGAAPKIAGDGTDDVAAEGAAAAAAATSDNLRSLLRVPAEDELDESLAKEKALEELNSLYEEYTFATAKDASLTDELRRRATTGNGDDPRRPTEDSLVYGEVDLEGFVNLLRDDIPHDSNDVFYDLGSGSGRAVFAARFAGDFRACVGIELLPNLHDLASSVASLYKFQYRHKLVHQRVEFICSDLRACDGWWREGTVVYVPNLLFDEDLKRHIAERAVRLRPGARLICLKKFRGAAFGAAFELAKERPVTMSWGESNVYVYRRRGGP